MGDLQNIDAVPAAESAAVPADTNMIVSSAGTP
jgi:hypothetical protein